ncbi:MAG TPA: inorganic phosphate transporter [Candidatus Omnitrophica bacterium]|nr:MAG: phosphate permease [Omnitrophica WOR_2 bacterium GWA2_53_43]HBO97656.1 inorganic phosphate transporter [Candidatus Omnitrophota bacterium]HCI44722.1 inorganic phosphate transporter [Candidatus Omnitrophota bacterium]
MEWTIFIILATLFVAYTNGANDNFKGVATLFGSGTTDYRKALGWATITTLAGSVTAFFFATNLVKTFSGKGLVPDALIATPEFLLAVALGASATVLLATLTGIPISTTHSLTGALVGAGLVAIGADLGFSTLGKNFFIPLLSIPFIAVVFTFVVYMVFRFSRQKLGVGRSTCVCMGEKVIPVANVNLVNGQMFSVAELKSMEIFVDEKVECQARALDRYEGRVMGIDAQQILDTLHFASAGAVSFARGLNDTPKIVALAVTTGALGLKLNIGLVAIVMALGGILSAKKVAETMSHRITAMNHGQGFTANLITAILVIFASKMGVPVSTTHVSCGSLFGIGLVNGKANWKIIGGIVSAWVLTLPIAALLSAGFYWGLRMIGS